MNTYSDNIKPLRLFLLTKGAHPSERLERPDQYIQESWMIDEVEIIIRIQPDGTWRAFIPASKSIEVHDQIATLERYLLGNRPDLDLIHDMANITRLFISKLQEMPVCTDMDCGQKACTDNRALQLSVESFLARLLPSGKTKEKV